MPDNAGIDRPGVGDELDLLCEQVGDRPPGAPAREEAMEENQGLACAADLHEHFDVIDPKCAASSRRLAPRRSQTGREEGRNHQRQSKPA